MKKNIFLALDLNSLEKALDIAFKTKDYLAGIKIGLELYNIIGIQGIKEFDKLGLPIFLDTKIFDIPNQVAKTIKFLKNIKGIQYYTIHAMGSLDMLKTAQQEVVGSKLELLAVSVLTSSKKIDLEKVGITNTVNEQVKILVDHIFVNFGTKR